MSGHGMQCMWGLLLHIKSSRVSVHMHPEYRTQINAHGYTVCLMCRLRCVCA